MNLEEVLNGKKDDNEDVHGGGGMGFEEEQDASDNSVDFLEGNALPLKRKIKKLKLLAVVGVLIMLGLIGFIVFKKFTVNKTAVIFPPQSRSFIIKKPNLILSPPGEGKAVKGENPAAIRKTGQVSPSIQEAPASLKKNTKNLNDLFKLKDAEKPKAVSAGPHPPVGLPAYQVPAPNFNGIPPNVLQNIKARINGGINETPSGPKVLGVSNKFAVIQYGGADLYLKAGDSFGNCTVMGINSFDVKIACSKRLKKYPIEFGRGRKKASDGIINTVNTGVKK